MGQFIGRGNWVFSYEEKQAFKREKEQQFWDKVAANRAKYLNLSNLRSFLTPKQIEEFFPTPDKTVNTRNGVMKQYDYKKVLSILKRKKVIIKIKSGFEDIRIEEVKEALRQHNSLLMVNKLDKKLPPKGTPKEKPKKI